MNNFWYCKRKVLIYIDDITGLKIFSKKSFKKFVRIKRSVTFAPANPNRLTNGRGVARNVFQKKRRHVPRHIELTAVLREISEQIKKE